MLVIMGLALLVRMGPLTSALPYTSYVDEGFILNPSAHMVSDTTWDPGWYGYPSLLIGSTAAVTKLNGLIDPDVARQAALTDERPGYDPIGPASMILIGRSLVLLASLGTVVVTMFLGRRLAGRWAGVVSGLLAALLPALVVRSAIVIVDAPATFFVMASILAASGATARSRRGLLAVLGAGACAGLAMTSKYPSGSVILVALVVLAFSGLDRREQVRRAVAAAVTMAAAAVVTMPALLLRTSEVRDAIDEQVESYQGRSSTSGYLQQLLSVKEVGWLVAALAAIGLVLLLVRPRTRVLTAGWVGFATVLLLSLVNASYQPFRNLLPLTPFLAVLAAAALVAGARAVATARNWDARSELLAIGTVALVAVAVVGLTGTRPAVQPHIGVTDTRTAASDWLAANTEEGQQVLVADQLGFLPSDLDRIPADVTVASILENPPAADGDAYDLVVTMNVDVPLAGDWDVARTSTPTVSFGQPRKTPRYLGLGTSFAGIWRGNDELIRIFTTAGDDDDGGDDD